MSEPGLRVPGQGPEQAGGRIHRLHQTSISGPEVYSGGDRHGGWQREYGAPGVGLHHPLETEIGVAREKRQKTTLDVKKVDPEALSGLLQSVTDIGALNLPNVFRYWQEKARMGPVSEFTFGGFVQYFRRAEEDGRLFRTLNTRGEESDVTFHKGTFDNVLRNLDPAVVFFDNPDSVSLDERDILVKGKLSVINV